MDLGEGSGVLGRGGGARSLMRAAAEQAKVLGGWSPRPGHTEIDAANKKHPSIRPYDRLSQEEKDKDREMIRVLPLQLTLEQTHAAEKGWFTLIAQLRTWRWWLVRHLFNRPLEVWCLILVLALSAFRI